MEEPLDLTAATHIILPGVGSFASFSLNQGWRDALHTAADNGGKVLGICLGMQMLGDTSEEGDGIGLGLIPGRSRKLALMRMGWDKVYGLGEVYFFHQY